MSISGNGQEGVLHTKSSYFHGQYLKGSKERSDYFIQSKLRKDFIEAKNYAEQEEQKFYNLFFPGVTTFANFITEMKKIFAGVGKDGQRIKRLSNANFHNILGTKADTLITDKLEYTIVVTGDSKKISFPQIKTESFIIDGEDMFINVDNDVFNAKTILNYLRNHPDIKKKLNTNPGRYTESTTKEYVKDWFKQEMKVDFIEAGKSVMKELGSSGVFIKISNKAEQKTTTASGLMQIAEKYPLFNVKASDIKKRLNDPKQKTQIKQELGKIIEQLKIYLFNSILEVNNGCVINGVNILKEAANIAWRNNLSQRLNGDPMFFFVGGNLADGLKGQLGEFQLDILTQYTLLATGKTNPKLGHIIGGIVDGSRQQPRSDYQIIIDLGGNVGNTIMGIQVKNYKESQMKKVEINTDLGLVAPNLEEGFVNTLANTQFNIDIYQQAPDVQDFLKKFLEKYFWKAMNLNVGEGLDPMHTNTFYWMGGTAIVPASMIIDTIFNNNIISNPTFIIKGFKKPVNSNIEFSEGDPPLFTEYWNGNKYIGWDETTLNHSAYNDYLDNIRIHTKINMLSILNNLGGIGNFEFF